MPLGNLKDKFAFGWTVVENKNGNNIIEVIRILGEAKALTGNGKPIVILMQMGNGVDYMMGTHKWHGSAPNDEQLASALAQNEETLGDY